MSAQRMGVFMFVCRSSGDEWSAKELKGNVEASAGSTYELQRKLVQAALSCDSSGGVQSSFSFITPSSAVFQGPILLEDYHLVEKLANFDRDRIPERVVHARGGQCQGFFRGYSRYFSPYIC